MLDQHRAFLLAGAAGDAGPDLVLLDRVADQFLGCRSFAPLLCGCVAHRLIEVFASVDDDHLWIERLTGQKGRALLLAAAALGAGIEVEQVLPRPLGDGAHAVVLGVLEIDRRQLGADPGGQLAEEDVGDGDDDVQVLRARNVREKGQNAEDVDPVEDFVRRNGRAPLPTEPCEHPGDRR